MVFQFKHVGLDNDPQFGKWSLKHPPVNRSAKRVLSDWQTALHGKPGTVCIGIITIKPALFRVSETIARLFGSLAKMLAATLHFLEGRLYVYQGEELGMTNVAFPSIHDYRDLDTLNAWHELVEQQHALAQRIC